MLWVLLVVVVLDFLLTMSTYGALERVRRTVERQETDLWALRNGTTVDQAYEGVTDALPGLKAPGAQLVQDLESWRARHDMLRRQAEKEAPESTIHMCPPPGLGVTLCCGANPMDLPSTDQMTLNAAIVTCKGPKAG